MRHVCPAISPCEDIQQYTTIQSNSIQSNPIQCNAILYMYKRLAFTYTFCNEIILKELWESDITRNVLQQLYTHTSVIRLYIQIDFPKQNILSILKSTSSIKNFIADLDTSFYHVHTLRANIRSHTLCTIQYWFIYVSLFCIHAYIVTLKQDILLVGIVLGKTETYIYM
jgi:hypothetical protein